ncbi:hydrogen peroxide-inducible genes activator [Pseudobacteriovorax antillogorgiicola]|uniref:LysR family transcriptional regulator, hydrogen peroxide-inducible genes activator n=1 Tax=Pseudobacteriovorax antillogorgiicola TaxID=1513793 RepID=A0A1Y6BS54_9BACT|nr:hydrogen peroxide-inducible genes activator [Pseudobacteriovorax antillogorgiicola]TCS53762.1 LysR family hydrogen peroxide-inducible transcriptional activator [Pseudobacteriovorax antillogorgiicola]SMF22505.1 LysR family transcriptional regulator, hydrogen peroxide-inducible genes activator [Pseudobacteriovorax antillogorgiicola]
MPTISQIQYILAVDRYRHFGNAAKACHIAQPSLSMQIQKVEEELGFLIFDRNKKPVLATKKGERFIAQAKHVIREHEKLIKMSREDSDSISGDFRLGIIPTIMPYLLPKFIGLFSERFPGVTLRVDELKTQDIISELRKDTLDAGILATPLQEKGIRERPLFYEPFFLYAHEGHHLLGQEKVSPEGFSSEDIWLLEDGHCFKNQVSNFCSLEEKAGVYSNIIFEGGNLETLRYLVKESKGYTLVPYLFAENLPQEEKTSMVRPFCEPIPSREVSIVFSRDQWKTDIVGALQEVIQEALPSGLNNERTAQQKVIPV